MCKKKLRVFTIVFLAFAAVFQLTAQEEVRDIFNVAEARFRRGEFSLAAEIFQRIGRDYPLSGYADDSYLRLSMSRYRLGDYSQALAALNVLSQRYSQSPLGSQAQYWKALTLFRLGRLEESKSAFLDFFESSDEELLFDAFKRYGEILLKEGSYTELKNFLDDKFQIYPAIKSDRDLLLLYSQLLFKVEEYAMLIQYRENWKDVAGEDPWLNLYYAEGLFQTGELDKAWTEFEALSTSDASVAAIAYQRLITIARTTGELDRISEILSNGEEYLKAFPEVLDSFILQLAADSIVSGELEEAERYLLRLWAQKKDPQTALFLAELRIKQGRNSEALDYLDQADASLGFADRLPFKKGKILLDMGLLNQAEDVFSAFLEEYPESPGRGEARYYLALISISEGDNASAIQVLSAEEASYPKEAYLLLSIAHQNTGNLSAALSEIESYLVGNPDDLEAELRRVTLLAGLGRYSGVISESNKILGKYPTLNNINPSGFQTLNYFRALAYISRKDYQRAEQMLIDLPASSELRHFALYYRGWARYRQNNLESAYQDFTSYIQYYKGYSLEGKAQYYAGWASFNLQNYKKAADFFRAYVRFGGAEGFYLQGKSLEAGGSLEDARIAYLNVVNEYPGNEYSDDAYFAYAGLEARNGRLNASVEAFKNFPSIYPKSGLAEEAVYRGGQVAYDAGAYDLALDMFFFYRTTYPQGSYYDAALYWGAKAALDKGQGFQAALLWETLRDELPNSSYYPQTLLALARFYESVGRYREALNNYADLVEGAPELAKQVNAAREAEKIRFILLGQGEEEAQLSVRIAQEGGVKTKAGREAMLSLARIYLEKSAGGNDLVNKLVTQIIESEESDPASLAQAWFIRGELALRSADYRTAIGHFIQAASADNTNADFMAHSMYRALDASLEAGSRRDANTLLQRLVDNFPDSSWTEAAKAKMEQ
jgi:TolA-binding protein